MEDNKENKFLQLLKSNTTGPLILVGSLVVLLIGFAVLLNIVLKAKNRPQYVQGDFSEYVCSITNCENQATWRYSSCPNQNVTYYCDEHSDEGQARYDLATSKKASKASEVSDGYGHDKYDAIVVAKTIIKRKLKSPSTAEFCKSSEYTVNCSGNTWTIKGYVDAQNSFGAALRNDFTVKFTFTSSNNYTIDLCSFS